MESDKLMIKRFVVGPLQTNCYLVYGSASSEGILIDPGAPDPEINAYICDKGIDVVYILNTHGHADHIMGDVSFGFPVLIHELDEACLRDLKRNLSYVAGGGSEQEVRAEMLLVGGEKIKLGSLELEIIHTPGHTPGGISVRHKDVLFSGDTLFFEGVGRTDLPGGDHDTLIKSIKEKLFVLPDETKVFPGHGPETTVGHEKRFNPFM